MKIEAGLLPENLEISEKSKIAVQAALSGGRVLLSQVGGRVEEKEGVSNVVTEGDKEAAQTIRELISARFPQDQILSEDSEDELKDPLSIDGLWIVDPLDGSKNYSDGLAEVWVSVAYAQKGEVKAGAVYNPFFNQLYFADKGKGAYYHGPKHIGSKEIITEKLSISQKDSLSGASIETSISYNADETINHELIKLGMYLNGITPRFREIGSSVGQLCRVARGQSDLHFHIGLKPWDYAAGTLLVEEAGGVNKRMDGGNFSILSPDNVSGNPQLVNQFVNIVKQVRGNQELTEKLRERIKRFRIG